jgi:hypothetical protein
MQASLWITAGPNLLFDMLGGVSISMQRQGGVRASVAEGGDAMAKEPLLDMRIHHAGALPVYARTGVTADIVE